MDYNDYLDIEIKNLLAENRPNISTRTLNPYQGGCEGCPFCGMGEGEGLYSEGLYGGAKNTWTQFLSKVSLVPEGAKLTRTQKSKLYKSLSPDELNLVINVLDDDTLNKFIKVKWLTSTQKKVLELPEQRKVISTREPSKEKVIEEAKEALLTGLPEVIEIVKEVEKQVPTQVVEELNPEQLEAAKNVIAETYFQCLQRAPQGHKREMCRHLTKKYIKEKLEHIEKQEASAKYDNWLSCMVDNKGTKGIRKLCKPYVKKQKYKQTEEQKARTKARNKRISVVAKQLKKRYPRKSYQERIKMARKQV